MGVPESGMPDRPPAPAATPAAVEAPGESRTVALYRAALGPVNTERYLKVFARFDAVGRTRLVWHPAAAWCTLSWMLFRQLWTEALLYLAGVAGVIGAVLALWPQIQTWPVGVRAGLLGTLWLLSLVLPGLLGFTWMHRRIQQRVLRAVAAASTMGEACAALRRQAASRLQLQALVLANALIATGLLLGPVPCRSTACLGELRALLLPADASSAPTPPAPVTGVAPVGATTPLGVARRPARPDVPLALTPGQGAPHTEVAPAPSPETPVTPAQGAVAVPATTTVPPVPPRAERPEGQAAYAINVGLFADAGNAQRAQARLQQAGLPVVVQAVASAKGPLTRVRVGPYPGREAADEAAGRIRALGLEAVVFRP
jgi:cell division septation protein DedD